MISFSSGGFSIASVPLLIWWGGCSAYHSASSEQARIKAGGNAATLATRAARAGGFGWTILTPPAARPSTSGAAAPDARLPHVVLMIAARGATFRMTTVDALVKGGSGVTSAPWRSLSVRITVFPAGFLPPLSSGTSAPGPIGAISAHRSRLRL